jgi:hypothetical protein
VIGILSAIAAVVLVAVAVWRILRPGTDAPAAGRRGTDRRREPDWDDWPSDGRAP